MSNPKEEVVKKEGSSNRNSSEVKKLGHYWECNKNPVARMGKETRDGCREFMASSIAESDAKITTSLRCDACGCHRNFHRKKEEELGLEWLQSGNKVRYGVCHKNHWAQTGKYALDGCMEFIGSCDDEMNGDLKCDACGCHRNFHERKVVEDDDRSSGADDDSEAGLYEDCRKNHALDMGKDSYRDGCLEFMASTEDADPMKCDACGCHRNFHKRKEVMK